MIISVLRKRPLEPRAEPELTPLQALAKKARVNELLQDTLVRDKWSEEAFWNRLKQREIELLLDCQPVKLAKLYLAIIKESLLHNKTRADRIFKRAENTWRINGETRAIRDQADLLLHASCGADRPVARANEYLHAIQEKVLTDPKRGAQYYNRGAVLGIWYVNADTETGRLLALAALKEHPIPSLMTMRLEDPLRMYWTGSWSQVPEEQADARSDLIRKLLMYFNRNTPEIQQMIEKALKDGLINGVWLANGQTRKAYAKVLAMFEAFNYTNPIGLNDTPQIARLEPEEIAEIYCELIKKKAAVSSSSGSEILNSGIVNGVWIRTRGTTKIRCDAVEELERKKCKGQMHEEIESAFDFFRKNVLQSSLEKQAEALLNIVRKILMRGDRGSPEYQQMILRVIKEGFDRNLWHLNEETENCFMETLLWMDAFDCLQLYKDPHPPLFSEAQAFISFCAIEDLLDRNLPSEAINLYHRAEFNGVWSASKETKKNQTDAYLLLNEAGCNVPAEQEEAEPPIVRVAGGFT